MAGQLMKFSRGRHDGRSPPKENRQCRRTVLRKCRDVMDWDHLRFVLAVADSGGLSAASRHLRVDPATVSRRLDALEAALRCKLFHRNRQGLEPTAAGAKLVAHARR